MKANTLLDHFDQISEAPDAIPRLRWFILSNAVRGKLVDQYTEDESVDRLIKRIDRSMNLLVEQKKIKEPKLPHSMDISLAPFEIPSSWRWVFVGQFTCLETGKRMLGGAREEGVISLGGEHLNPDGTIDYSIPRHVSESFFDEMKTGRLKVGDTLMVKDGATTGKTCFVDTLPSDGRAAVNEHVFLIRPFGGINKLCYYFIRYLSYSYVKEQSQGVIGGIRRNDILQMPFPLPPLGEQARIKDAIDELLVLCKELEAAHKECEERRDRLVAATLYGMNNGDDKSDTPLDFKDSARFYFNNLPNLTTRPEHIEELRKTILNQAVRGRLVEQDLEDEPVSKVLSTDQRLLNIRKSVKESIFKANDTDHEQSAHPFEIPPSWEWVALGQVTDSRLGKMLDKVKNKGKPYPYLRNINVRWFGFDLSDLNLMRFEETELEKFCLRKGDVLICEGGQPGRSAVWEEDNSGIYFQKALHRVRFSKYVNPYYFVYIIFLDASTSRLEKFFTGVTIKHLTGKGLAGYTFPLPPLSEQHRIVAKVDELMALCDELDASLTTISETRSELLEAALHEALE
jgi:type I restriction enzyme S subunit